MDYFLRKLTAANQRRQLLLKSPANTARIKLILELYPDAKFIHIYRNPYDVFQSHLHMFKKLMPMLSLQHISDESLDEIVFATYIMIHEKFFSEKTLIPKGHLTEISYEDFIADPLKGLEEIYSDISLPGFQSAKTAFEEELKSYNDYTPNKFTMEPALAAKIKHRFHFAFEKFGYKSD
jgi:omega-hydroxy-beta-dihydromenaquinone-9 sulfotransferase